MSNPSKKAKIFDQLLSYLSGQLFQIPVRSFMDEHCVGFFDPGMEAGDEHKEIFCKYKRVVDLLLEAFCSDAKITMKEAVAAITKLSTISEFQDTYQMVFEQVLAADDFEVFYQVMVKRNIMIQEQVLLMIIAATGGLPQSLLPGGSEGEGQEACGGQSFHYGDDEEEDRILQEVMRRSKEEHDEMMAKQKEHDDSAIQKTVEISKQEVSFLKRERTQLEQDIGKMTIEDKPKPIDPPSSTPQASALSSPASLPPLTTQKYMTSADAAVAWMQAAKDESTNVNDATAAARTAMAASLSKLSQSELMERQKFLKTQRDRLLAMKKKEREEGLKKAEKSQSGRPQSARTARSAMREKQEKAESDAKQDAAEQEKLAMRRAIAAKLRQEVIGNQH